jgi:cell division protein FtsB
MLAKRSWPLVASAILACIVGYFIYHSVEGERGWVAQVNLQNEVDAARQRLVRLQHERQGLEHRVQLMRPGSMDPDLLEEESRKTLDFTKPGEIVILSPTIHAGAPHS